MDLPPVTLFQSDFSLKKIETVFFTSGESEGWKIFPDSSKKSLAWKPAISFTKGIVV